jgi:hypothetical protein
MSAPEPEQWLSIDALPGHRIRVQEMYRLVMIDEGGLTCSPGEYRVLLPLLQTPERVVLFAILMGGTSYPGDLLARQSLQRVISRLSAKLWL